MAKRVFFSFHYQDVIDFRANVVRNHNATKVDNGGFFDGSIWESSRKQGDLALKRLINGGLENTSMTAILIGSQTYSRRWVRYEIMKSVERGNNLLGIHINNIRDRNGLVHPLGPNPFEYLGLEINSTGRIGKPIEWDGQQWIYYKDLGPFPINEQPFSKRNNRFQFTAWFPTYDWINDSGFEKFSEWIEA